MNYRHKKRNLSEDDAEIWRRLARTITPLKADSEVKEEAEDYKSLLLNSTTNVLNKNNNIIKESTLKTNNTAAPKPREEPLDHGKTVGIDRRTAQRFLRGRMVIDSRLDLHGMTRERAHKRLVSHLLRAHDLSHRCILVITGKGSRTQNTSEYIGVDSPPGILRNEVPHWLNMAPLRDIVLSFSHAKPWDGGEGALYILLKRHR